MSRMSNSKTSERKFIVNERNLRKTKSRKTTLCELRSFFDKREYSRHAKSVPIGRKKFSK